MDAIADTAGEIADLAGLLGVVLAGEDADTCLDGIYRVVLEIKQKAEHLKQATAGLGR